MAHKLTTLLATGMFLAISFSLIAGDFEKNFGLTKEEFKIKGLRCGTRTVYEDEAAAIEKARQNWLRENFRASARPPGGGRQQSMCTFTW